MMHIFAESKKSSGHERYLDLGHSVGAYMY